MKKTFKKLFTTKAAKRGWISLIITILFIAVIVVLNVVTSMLVDKFPVLSADLTTDQVFEMQQQTIDFIKDIDKEVTISVLSEESTLVNSGSSYYVQANKLIKQFSQYCDNIKVKYVNLDTNPTYLNNYKGLDTTDSNILMIVELGASGTQKTEKEYRALSVSDLFEVSYDESTYQQYISGSNVEQAVTTAILNVTNQNKVKIALITGAGEKEENYKAFVTYLENNAYEVEKTAIATDDIDKDAKAIILFTPAVDLSKDSINKIETFLDNSGNYGKNLLYFPSQEEIETPNIDKLLESWSLQLSDGLVYETDYSRLLQNNYFYFTVNYGTEYIEGLKNQSVPVITGYSRAITINDEETCTPLLTTSNSAGIVPFGAEDDFKLEDGIKNEALNIGAISSKTSENTGSNIVVIGSSTVVSDSALSTTSFNNGNYVINLINTLTQRDDLGITIEGKAVENKELGITSISDPLIIMISTFFRFILPIGILIAGLVVWILRRNK